MWHSGALAVRRHLAEGLRFSRRTPSHFQNLGRYFSVGSWDDNAKHISLNFILKDGTTQTVSAPIGSNLVEVAHRNQVPIEAACECSLACSTCHVIVEGQEDFDKTTEVFEMSEREEDLLDMAPGLEDTSRLICTMTCCDEIDGMTFRLPTATRNFYVDGFIPSPH
eukprot:GDKH01020511.1.p1 GENE.GDKH01020511.1~~GDKH01020511.1.p1  ORF type:complete len:166 (-),score=11.84 GDKH01020511.1:216-713(-)